VASGTPYGQAPQADRGDDVQMNPWDDLKDLEKQIAELEETVRSMHARIGDRDDSPSDPEELATHLTEIEEQEAVLGTLRERADTLRERQGG
jgi:hypothetical protein